MGSVVFKQAQNVFLRTWPFICQCTRLKCDIAGHFLSISLSKLRIGAEQRFVLPAPPPFSSGVHHNKKAKYMIIVIPSHIIVTFISISPLELLNSVDPLRLHLPHWCLSTYWKCLPVWVDFGTHKNVRLWPERLNQGSVKSSSCFTQCPTRCHTSRAWR